MTTSQDQGRNRGQAWAWLGAALAAFGLLLWLVLAPESWPRPGAQRQVLQIGDVSYAVNAREWQGARAAALHALAAAEAEALIALEAELDEHLARLFVLPRSQVSAAADWYYSFPGQVIRAGSAMGADVGGRLIERLFPPEPWSEQQAALVASLAASADGHVRRTGEVVLTSFQRELRDRRRDAPPAAGVPALSFDFSDSAVLEELRQDPVLERQAVALATSALAALAARRAAQAAAARGAGRQVGTGLTAACVSTGVAAWICAGGVFGVTLLSTEVVLMRLDESQNREQFEAALLAELDRIETEFAAALREAYLGALARSFEKRQQTMRQTLRPVDLLFGLAPEDQPRRLLGAALGVGGGFGQGGDCRCSSIRSSWDGLRVERTVCCQRASASSICSRTRPMRVCSSARRSASPSPPPAWPRSSRSCVWPCARASSRIVRAFIRVAR